MNALIHCGTRFLVLVAMAIASASAQACVDLKNGNFVARYADIGDEKSSMVPKIERLYDSRNRSKGMFGWGWLGSYESRLAFASDGSIVLVAMNCNLKNVFRAESSTAAASIRRNDRTGDSAAITNATAADIADGTRLISSQFHYQSILKTRNGYIHARGDGNSDIYDTIGRLQRMQDRSGNWIQFSYGVDGRLELVRNNLGRAVTYRYNARGLVESIENDRHKRAEYRYNDADELVETIGANGQVLKFGYDGGHQHKIQTIATDDGSVLAIVYDDQEPGGKVRKVTQDLNTTIYRYELDAANPDHRTTSFTVNSPAGEQISGGRNEYFMRRNRDGEEWVERMIAVLDGITTETTYNECCWLPVQIVTSAGQTSFEYDSYGRVTRKETPTELILVAYDSKLGKVTRVLSMDKRRNELRWYRYLYDAAGNPVTVQDFSGADIELAYGQYGWIASMKDQQTGALTRFAYNANGKPVRIAVRGLGVVTTAYDDDGEVLKVSGTGGRRAALQVTSIFGKLLSAIRPAEISLSF